MKKTIVAVLLLFLFLSCSKDETKTQHLINSRPTIPVQNGEVQIGTQVWMTKNLNVSRYSDGTIIPEIDPSQWANLTTGAWCYYNNDPANGSTYGKLYNWYAAVGIYNSASRANPALRKKIAPIGWHIPSDAEWFTLTTFLGGANMAGGKMKEAGTAHWVSPNTNATNSSGFTGLAGGFCSNDGTYINFLYTTRMWSSSESTPTTFAWGRGLTSSSYALRTSDDKTYGLAVRCLKD